MSTTSARPSLGMFSGFRNIPWKLWALAFGQALCFTVSAVLSYLGIKETARTDAIMHGLNRLHLGPIAFHNAFYFNLGQQLFSVVVFTIYILMRKRYRLEIFSPMISHAKYLVLTSLAYIAAEYTYFLAFTTEKETSILLALDNLSIPTTMTFSFFLLKEQMNENKLVGASLIVLGGVMAVL
jgi:uncharacterized membrane protein